jgi:hypothetical protein
VCFVHHALCPKSSRILCETLLQETHQTKNALVVPFARCTQDVNKEAVYRLKNLRFLYILNPRGCLVKRFGFAVCTTHPVHNQAEYRVKHFLREPAKTKTQKTR